MDFCRFEMEICVEQIGELLRVIDDFVWGPVLLFFMMGTGIYLMLRMHFLPIRNLGYALKCVLGKDDNSTIEKGEGEISPFSALTTELAATIGTGNMVGVATALVLGGPGALIWMNISALIGFSTKLAESMLSVKYRTRNAEGAISGGPMYTLRHALGQSFRWGVSRGVFSNEAGLGAAGISAAAAHTNNPVRQGYISMTGVFFDTTIICTMTGLAICSSGLLGSKNAGGELLTGCALTIGAFETVFGSYGAKLVAAGIVFFAFSTIIGWAYEGEKAFEFLFPKRGSCLFYRLLYAFATYLGAICTLEMVWDFSDIMNGLMAIPNLICVLALSGTVCRDIRMDQKKNHR